MVAVQARAGIREGPAWPLAGGIIAGVVLDAVFGDPRRGHPVAVFGRAAQALQDRVYRDSVPHGAGYAALCIYGPRHPSPNAGRCEAAFADALGVRLGGTNTYGGVTEERQWLGDGRGPEPADIATAVRLCRADDCGCGDRAAAAALVAPRAGAAGRLAR
jgi:cobalamin biosynthesis protein CobD/CbiB